ncbi:hypothetical protein CCDG5_0429 [[Clostridium] cellulosi]|uniref:HAD family phosphatase n=1 Tax=[Clostridium] cellulosi TaxID=29343 RepID=A0A078KM28_9FIRM|nr:hypothetical protein CCDG5_0429 [[Clostridium] cellulosi]
MSSIIKNIVFDMGMVLLNFQPLEYCLKTLKDQQAAKAIYENLFCGDEWVQCDKGVMTEAECIASVQKRIPQYAQYVPQIMADWPASLSAMPGMEELVRKLKDKGYGLYLLSNTSHRFYEFSKHYPVFQYFDGMVISAAEKLLKPDPAIYKLLCSRFRLLPEECIFIDDVQANVEAAKNIGMAAHKFEGASELSTYFKNIGIL